MKLRSLAVAAIVMFAACVWAQSTPPADAQGQTGAGATKSTQKTPGTGKGPAGAQGMGAMHAQHMQQMQADIAKMQSLLNSMRTNVSSMDPKDQPAMMNNIELWQMMVDHMNEMVKHMGSMGGPGMMHGAPGGTMHHHGAMGTMKEGTPSSGTSKPTTPPPPPPQQ